MEGYRRLTFMMLALHLFEPLRILCTRFRLFIDTSASSSPAVSSSTAAYSTPSLMFP
jgi:hypothetical protein